MPDSAINNRLIAQCLAGERAAWRRLYDRSLPSLSLTAKRYLLRPDAAQDVLQESYVRIFQNLGQYDAGRATFSIWATRIVINRCLKWNARERRAALREIGERVDAPGIDPVVVDRLSNAELIAFLRRMPETYYTVFSLHVIDGFSHAEIGELLGIQTALSRQRLVRARSWLKKNLPTDCGATVANPALTPWFSPWHSSSSTSFNNRLCDLLKTNCAAACGGLLTPTR